MIKFTSKIGPYAFLLFSFMVALNLCATMIWGVFGIWIPFAIITTINLLFVFPKYFGTFYYLKEDELRITSFWFCINKKIAYEDIVVAIPKQMTGIFPALSSDGIEIVYMEKGKTKQTFVSPAMFETFLNQLTDNIMVSNVLKSDRASTSDETKQYLIKKQEIEEEKAIRSKKDKSEKLTKETTSLSKKKFSEPTKKPAKKTVKKVAKK